MRYRCSDQVRESIIYVYHTNLVSLKQSLMNYLQSPISSAMILWPILCLFKAYSDDSNDPIIKHTSSDNSMFKSHSVVVLQFYTYVKFVFKIKWADEKRIKGWILNVDLYSVI